MAPETLHVIAWIGVAHFSFCRNDCAHADGHQESSCLFHRESARVYVSRRRRRRICSGYLPSDDPCVLQSLPVPWLRQRHSRHGRRAGYAQDGRSQASHAVHVLDVRDRSSGDCRYAADRRIFFQGRNSLAGVFKSARRADSVGARCDWRRNDRFLHVPAVLHGLFWREPGGSSHSGALARITQSHDLTSCRTRNRFNSRRLDRASRRFRRQPVRALARARSRAPTPKNMPRPDWNSG